MNNVTHAELARIVGTKARVPELEEFVAGATLPDYINDLLVKAVGSRVWRTKLLGYPISPWQHFDQPIGGMKHNGYCMDRDPSWPKELNVPLGQLKSYPSVWSDALPSQGLSADLHPMESIIKVSTGNAPQKITYCTAPVYADWIRKQITRPEVRRDPRAFWKGVGAIAHLAMDLCVWHHVFLCLLNGHQAYEGKIQEYGLANREWLESLPLPSIAGPFELRTQLELIAEMTGSRKSPPQCAWALRKGFEATYMVIVWARSV